MLVAEVALGELGNTPASPEVLAVAETAGLGLMLHSRRLVAQILAAVEAVNVIV